MCGLVHVRKPFARQRMEADATLQVAADTDSRTRTRPSEIINCAIRVVRV